LVVLNATNTYTGGTVPAEATTALGVSTVVNAGTVISGPIGTGPLYLTSDSSSLTASAVVEASVNNITVANPIEYPSGTNNFELEVGGVNNITFSGPFTLNGNDNNASASFNSRMLQVTNTGITTFSGAITDGGLGGNDYGLTVNGNGTTTNFVGPLILTATETYSGPTTNAGAVLLINGQVGPGEVFVTNSGTLGGNGTITGPVVVSTNSTLAAGTATTPSVMAIGTLTINNSLTFMGGGRALVKVNGANSDEFSVSGTLTYNGTLIATNTGSALSAGASFPIFPAGGSGNFTTISGTPGPGQTWSFDPTTGLLTVNGSPEAPFTISPGITNITFLSGTNVTISGTNGQSGGIYYLLTSTNLLTPISKWKPVSTNVASGNIFSFTATNALTPGDHQQFFQFANTNF
jgi:fibronectin-binding autotransporter adhesin